MKYQQKNYLFLVFALFMGCMVLFNSCDDDEDCIENCGENGTCVIDNGLAICQCDVDSLGVLLYNGTKCENLLQMVDLLVKKTLIVQQKVVHVMMDIQ